MARSAAIRPHRAVSPATILATLFLVLLCAATIAIIIWAPRVDEGAGTVGALPVDEPVLKEVERAQVYLLRRPDGDVIAFWGMSPLASRGNGPARCFIQDRRDRSVRGETRPFVDPCHAAWWSRDGRFLGYTGDPDGSPSDGPPLVRIPATVRDGRIHLDEDRLRCLQSRGPVCE